MELLDSALLSINAAVSHQAIRKHKPSVTNAGAIRNTPLQYILKLKVGARIMLTYNLDTSDGLTNGALGEAVGYDISPEGRIQRIFFQFFHTKVGKERRKAFLNLAKRFPGKMVHQLKN